MVLEFKEYKKKVKKNTVLELDLKLDSGEILTIVSNEVESLQLIKNSIKDKVSYKGKILFNDKNASKEDNYGINLDARSEKDKEIQKKLHQTVKKVTDSIEDDFHFNTAIAAIMELLNDMTTYKQNVIDKNDISSESKKVWHEVLEKVILLIAPFAPHVADELWSDLGNTTLTFEQEWPTFDEKLTVENNFNLVLQVNGKVRDMIPAQIGISKDDAEKLAFSSEKVQKFIDGKEVIKVIAVPNKLVNIVVKG